MNNKIFENYFYVLFSLIPISIIIGPAVSLINILLIDFLFIFLILYKQEYKFLYNKTVKFIIFFCLYLIFNSLISKDFLMGAQRNFGFIRFGILFLAFNYFFYNKSFFNKVLMIWTITLLVLCVDTYIESIFGENILGYSGKAAFYGERIVSFFKDEPIVGGYINAFYLIVIGYLFNLINKSSIQYKNIILIFSIFLIFAILLTGERSNSIKALFGFSAFYFFNDFFKLKQKILSLLLLISLIGILLSGSDFLKLRYGGQFLKTISFVFQTQDDSQLNYKLENNLYYKLYGSGLAVFKQDPIFGVGNKNYRVETCVSQKDPTYICNTHPHQVYFEFLSEHGLIGSSILLFILFYLIFSKSKVILISKNYIQIGCLIFLSILFIPFLPSGAFFSDYNLTIFWINLSIMYAVGKKTNIYLSN
jgi:O-antigen ligase